MFKGEINWVQVKTLGTSSWASSQGDIPTWSVTWSSATPKICWGEVPRLVVNIYHSYRATKYKHVNLRPFSIIRPYTEDTKGWRTACFEGKRPERKHNKPHKGDGQITVVVYGKRENSTGNLKKGFLFSSLKSQLLTGELITSYILNFPLKTGEAKRNPAARDKMERRETSSYWSRRQVHYASRAHHITLRKIHRCYNCCRISVCPCLYLSLIFPQVWTGSRSC